MVLCSIGTTDCRNIAEAPDQTELPLTYGMQEVAKYPIPDGKFVEVACVLKSVLRIIE